MRTDRTVTHARCANSMGFHAAVTALDTRVSAHKRTDTTALQLRSHATSASIRLHWGCTLTKYRSRRALAWRRWASARHPQVRRCASAPGRSSSMRKCAHPSDPAMVGGYALPDRTTTSRARGEHPSPRRIRMNRWHTGHRTHLVVI